MDNEKLVAAIRVIWEIIEEEGSGYHWQREMLRNILKELESEQE